MSGEPISYLALENGTPVQSSGGKIIGKVEHVLQLPEEDSFDGLVVTTSTGLRFVDRDQITEIHADVVETSLTDDQVAKLPPPEGTADYHADATQDIGKSLSARFGRMFGREHWMKDG